MCCVVQTSFIQSLMSWVCSTVLCSPQSILAFTDVSEVGNDEELDSISPTFFDDDDKNEEPSADSFPPPMAGGVALDQTFAVSAKALNAIMFKSGSQFVADALVALKTTGYQEEPWKKVGSDPIRRTVTYMKAATKLVKSVKATEVQTYTRADDQGFIVHVSCDTPDVPYGSNFFIELQVCPFIHRMLRVMGIVCWRIWSKSSELGWVTVDKITWRVFNLSKSYSISVWACQM